MKKIAQMYSNVQETMACKCDINGMKVFVVSGSWPFSCPAPTVLLSRSFSFQPAFSSFSMVGITVNMIQQVLSWTALGCTRWREKYFLSNKNHLTPNYFLSLSTAFLMALIEEDIWGAEGHRLFARLGEVLSVWVDQYLDREQSKVSKWRELEKNLRRRVQAGERLGGRRVSGAARRAAFYSACERLNKNQTKKPPWTPLNPFRNQNNTLALLDKLSRLCIDFQ